jgi:hypothetical protein
MKSAWTLVGVFLVLAATTNVAFAKGKEPKQGRLTGTWECVAHSSAQNDMQFTLKLAQTDDTVTGTFVDSSGEYRLSSASYEKGVFEIHVKTPEGSYVITGRVLRGQLSGHWSRGQEVEGGWEGTKSVPGNQKL